LFIYPTHRYLWLVVRRLIFFVIKIRTARPRAFRFGRPRTTLRRATAVFNPLRTVYRTLRRAVPNPFRDILPRWARRRTVFRRR